MVYNWLHKYLLEEKLSYPKYFGFWKSHFRDHAIVQHAHEIYDSFGNDNCTPKVFIESSKTFDTVDHSSLLKKLEMYRVNTTYLAWFSRNLYGGKQHLKITKCTNTLKQHIKCGVLQDSILGQFTILYANDVPNFWNVLVPIMFAMILIYFLSTLT